MRDRTLIGPWIRRFLLEHLVSDRNLTRNTQASYRDTLLLLLPFVSQAQKKANRSPDDRRSLAVSAAFIPGISGEGTWLQWRYAQSTSRRDPLTGEVHRYAQPGTCSLVHRNPCGSVQEDAKIQSHLPRQTGNRCALESPRSANATGEPRLRITTVPLQHRCTRGGSCAADD
jgi:site-specific recombinase XerD